MRIFRKIVQCTRTDGDTIYMKSRLTVTLMVILFLFLFLTNVYAQVPSDFYLEAFCGSYAPWGINQLLKIDSAGNVKFYESDLESPVGSHIYGTLGASEIQTIYDMVIGVNFFSLNNLYDEGAVDGSGIGLHIIASGADHSVEARNIAVPEVNQIARTLNTVLAPLGIRLSYGALNK